MTEVQVDTTLYELAKEAYEDAENTERAVAKLVDKIQSDPKLFKAITTQLIRMAAHEMISRIVNEQRRTIREYAGGAPTPNSTTVRGYHLSARTAFMDFPLAGGQRLGDATKKDLMVNIDGRRKSLRTQQVDVMWLEAIAKSLSSDGAKVRTELKEADLAHVHIVVSKASKPATAQSDARSCITSASAC